MATTASPDHTAPGAQRPAARRVYAENAFPNWAVAVLGALCLGTLLAVGIYRALGYGPVSPAALARTVLSVELAFEDGPEGTVIVRDAADGRTLDVLVSGEDGFLRSLMRSLVRTRRQHDVGREVPFVLAMRGDGHLTLTDPGTKQVVHLRAFGPSNEAAFRDLLAARYPNIDEIPLAVSPTAGPPGPPGTVPDARSDGTDRLPPPAAPRIPAGAGPDQG